MRAAVLVDSGQPGRAGIHRVRSWRRPGIELLSNCGPINRRQPIRLTQILDLHKGILSLPADILVNGVKELRSRLRPERTGRPVGKPAAISGAWRSSWGTCASSCAATPFSLPDHRVAEVAGRVTQ